MATLSVCIVTKNEEHNIESALQTIKFAEEIIIVDDYSTDCTVGLAAKYTNKIYLNAWQGCGVQKKFALEKATQEWVLILDADERLSVDLQLEIQNIVKQNSFAYAGYYIPFQSFYLGKAIKFGDWFREQHVRLFRRFCGNIVPNFVHFGLLIDGKIGKLNNKIMHYSLPNQETVLSKINAYSSLGAKDKLAQGGTANIFTAIFHGLFAFVRGYIFKLGFLDGKYGFMVAVYNAECSYYKYLKLMLLINAT